MRVREVRIYIRRGGNPFGLRYIIQHDRGNWYFQIDFSDRFSVTPAQLPNIYARFPCGGDLRLLHTATQFFDCEPAPIVLQHCRPCI